MRAEDILELVDDEQREAVLAPAGPLLVVAGAGTGKTRTLTARLAHRVARGDVPGAGVLAVTHSTRAAGELRERLARLSVDGLDQVAARTIHAAARNQLRFGWAMLGRDEEPQICTDRFATVRAVARRAGVDCTVPGAVVELTAEIEWAKARLCAPADYPDAAADRRTDLPAELIADVYERYTQALRRRGLLDYTDLLTEAAAVLAEHDAIAEAVRRRVQFLLVDEYQDVDAAQQRLLDAWLSGRDDVTAVGDPRQSIYAFKGAQPDGMAAFADRFPGTRTVTLTRNYRSTPAIVTAANALAATLRSGPRPRAAAARARFDVLHPAPLTATRPDGPMPQVRACADEAAEARWVAGQVARTLRTGTPPREVAVLVRFNSQLAAFADELTAAHVPFSVADGDRFFARPEVVAVLQQMGERLYGAARRGAGFDDNAYDGGGAELLSGPSLLREVLADFGHDRARMPETDASRAIWQSRQALLDWVEALPGAELLGSRELLDELQRATSESHQVRADEVLLATMHRAKGLEFDVVFAARWCEGSVPSALASGDAELAEEARLAYVTMTRARRVLTISYPQRRGARPQTPSQFLTAAGFTVSDGATSVPAAARGRRPAGKVIRCRRCSVPLEDPALVALAVCVTHLHGDAARRWQALRSWRTDVATMHGVPPYRVLTDATLLALVAAVPGDVDALARVHGIGPAKVASYGADLLALLRQP